MRVGGSGRYRTIQEAIDSALPGATIQVAQGTYRENITVGPWKTIRLEGGWDAGFTSRTNSSLSTVVDGGGRGSVFSIDARDRATIDVTIEGFTIRNGKADSGGGIWARAAVPGANVILTLNDNTITANAVRGVGAGVYAGVLASGSSLTLSLTRNSITGNNSEQQAGGVGIRCASGTFAATITDNQISKNTTYAFGGGVMVMCAAGGSMDTSLLRNTIADNKVLRTTEGGGWDGGGVAVYTSASGSVSYVSMANNVITGNEAAFGGGVYGHSLGEAATTVALTNNVIAANKALRSGGGVFSLSGSTGPEEKPGGTIDWILTNNTITGNLARDSAGVGSNSSEGGATTISSHNDIVWGNTATDGTLQVNLANVGKGQCGPVTLKVSYSNIPSMRAFKGAIVLTDNLMNKDPLFTDSANNVFSLREASPCIDSGESASAYCDGRRPPGKGTERNDMGAYGGPNNWKWTTQS